MPLLLCLKTTLRLQGVSAIADTRLGQSGSGPQRDTVHNKSLQREQDIGADPSSKHLLAKVTAASDAQSCRVFVCVHEGGQIGSEWIWMSMCLYTLVHRCICVM
jgi:hypothetical protein